MRNEMKNLTDLPALQKEYDAMVKIANQSIARNVELNPKFERELTLLMRAVKGLGGRV
jgi:hypothetical protein